MVTLFQPLLANALIYVDDILLFSKDADSHEKLLTEFYNLVKSEGIMLSEKKMVIRQISKEVLGMTILDGKYTLQPHITTSLKEFPAKLSTAKQIQQFLGIVNYMFDFIPKISKYRNCLAQLLKKNPLEWDSTHTEAVQQLKKLVERLPPLQIPGPGKRVLQTDASDEYWAATLFEEIDGKRNICGYKSGAFKTSRLHYHCTFKEILAVKNGIEKFQFHLLGHNFLVKMDMSSFPKMLQFKRKMLPHPQLLRWSNWFSQWSFQVRHIEGKDNLITNYLSRKSPAIKRSHKNLNP